MRLNLLVSAVAVLVAVLPRCSCRSADTQGEKTRALPPPLPLLMRLGEEYFIRLDNAAAARGPPRTHIRAGGSAPDERETTVNRALQLQLTQWLERAGLDPVERARRAEEPPISLDLTFHLLREVLEMARAEQIAQQADNNRKMMDIYGK
ncbi:corticoliberin-1 [Alosa alosa]|uniref:corticoliberin-1 n=1 Tax=Alosa alosa TaxID=278164 RepID=UPI0020152107|nr:corticoliberin-1 [Alosa alosa]